MVSAGVLLAASLATLASTSPVPADAPSTSFKVTRYPNPNFVRHGPSSVYKTYLKYGKQPPAELVATVKAYRASQKAKRGVSGSAINTPENGDEEWITPVSIGTPAQVLNLDFDSGSSDLWVFSSVTPASESAGHDIYTPSKSTTAVLKSGYKWSISYGDGSSSSGTVYDDVVTIGNVTVSSQAVETATKVSDEFTSDTTTDGLLGLGFSDINTVTPTQQSTWFDNVKASLTSALWTADLNSEAPGTYTFGAVDTTAYTGSVGYSTVSSAEGYWTFTATGYAIGTAATVTSSISGIADTGTTLAYLPAAIVKAYYAKVSGATDSSSEGGYIFSCTATLPTFSFVVGGVTIEIPADYINYGPVETGSSTCFGGIQPNTGIGLTIFGDVALKSAFVIFDETQSTPRIGWAKKTL